MPYVIEIAQHFHYLGLVVLILMGGVGLPVPEDAALLLCGLLISTGTVHTLLALPLVYVSILAADLILYSIGRKFGRKIVEHRMLRRLIPPERLAAIEEKFRKWGTLFVMAGRQLPGLRAHVFLVSGVMHVPRLKLVLADAAASPVTIGVMVSLGYAGGRSFEVIQRDISRVGHVIVVAAVAALAVFLVVQTLRSMNLRSRK
jgi:membrane protein DedA with SNARE-associated domain